MATRSKQSKSKARPENVVRINNLEEAGMTALYDVAESIAAGCELAPEELLEGALLMAKGKQDSPRLIELQGYAEEAASRRRARNGA